MRRWLVFVVFVGCGVCLDDTTWAVCGGTPADGYVWAETKCPGRCRVFPGSGAGACI